MSVNDVVIQFARLWGQLEVTVNTAEDQEISNMLKDYNSEEMLRPLFEWANDYMSSDEEDTSDYFYKKVKELADSINKRTMCKCNECGKVFDWSEGYEDMFGDTICPVCGSEDIDEGEDEE